MTQLRKQHALELAELAEEKKHAEEAAMIEAAKREEQRQEHIRLLDEMAKEQHKSKVGALW